mmetsp:Transcript_16364/g.25189  ORF Transcript_16364/g.25189 Transcript_16364/m.25189 type:complete len:224 (-) Transcript_16364:182-853(-)
MKAFSIVSLLFFFNVCIGNPLYITSMPVGIVVPKQGSSPSSFTMKFVSYSYGDKGKAKGDYDQITGQKSHEFKFSSKNACSKSFIQVSPCGQKDSCKFVFQDNGSWKDELRGGGGPLVDLRTELNKHWAPRSSFSPSIQTMIVRGENKEKKCQRVTLERKDNFVIRRVGDAYTEDAYGDAYESYDEDQSEGVVQQELDELLYRSFVDGYKKGFNQRKKYRYYQ